MATAGLGKAVAAEGRTSTKRSPTGAGALTSPQYSEMNSFFCTDSLMKVPQPATSDGASSKCWSQGKRQQLWSAGHRLPAHRPRPGTGFKVTHGSPQAYTS